MTHEHYWEVLLKHDGAQYILQTTDRIVSSEWLGQRKEYYHRDIESAIARGKAFFGIYCPPRCQCEPPKPRYYVIAPNGSEIEQAEDAELEYYPRDGYLQFSVNGEVSKSYRRSDWRAVIFK